MFAQPRVWGDTEAGSCDPTPGAGISLHHDFHIPLSPQPGSRHTQLANPAPPQPCAFGLALQLPGGGHIPSTAVPGAGQSPWAVRQRDLSVCLAWCCCSLPAVSRCISRAQQRFPPEHGQHIPWQRGDTGGAAGALCPWGFTHGNRDSTEPLMLLLPPQQRGALEWHRSQEQCSEHWAAGTRGGKGGYTSGAASRLRSAPQST